MPRVRVQDRVVVQRGDLVVERDPSRPTGRLLRQDDMEGSYIDLADATHLEFDYLRWMRAVLTLAGARRVMHIGGGACALPRALAAADPDGQQEVCEVDGDVLALAREHLGLRRRPGLRVRHREGRAFVAGQPDQSWDAVVIDAFIGAAVPRRLITVEALADVARVAPLALINVVDDRAWREVATVGAALAAAYPRIWALGGRGSNTVLAGAAVAADLDRLTARLAADASPARLTPPDEMRRVAAAAQPWRDEDQEPAAGGPDAGRAR